MKLFIEGKEDLVNLVTSQLKSMGVKVPKIKKSKVVIPKQQEKGRFQSKLKVFGVRLDAQDVASNYSHLPKFILSCTDYLQKHSKEVGLFRKAGSVARQKNLRVKIENGGNFDGAEPNDVASLMKQWLRELPEPLIPSYLHDSLIKCQNLSNDESRIMSTLLICLFLPPDHLHTLKHLMCFLAEIATDKEKNRMGVHNLALIMAPNIFAMGTNFIDKSCNTKVQQYSSVIQLLIENADKIGELPPHISSKLANLEGTCQSELNSPNDVESSPSISRKQFLLRSIKKLVKQNSTPPTIQAVSPDSNKALSLRQPTAGNNCNEVKATASGAKGNGSLFSTRSSEDICKRSFGLLRKKEKKRLKITSDGSSITQSLGIESLLDFPIEMDKPNVHSTIQEPLLEKEYSIGDIFAVNHLDGKVAELEDIEMTTFRTHVTNTNENIHAFPIPSFLFQTQPEILFQNLETEKTDHMQEVHSVQVNKGNNTNLLHHAHDGQKLIKVTTSYTIDKMSKDNKESNSSKNLQPVQVSCSPKTLQLFTGEYQSTCEPNISPIREISSSTIREIIRSQSEYSYVMNNKINNTEIKDSPNVDSKYLQSIDTELLREMSSRENVGMFQMKIRQDTFIIEPKQKASLRDEVELLNQKQMCDTFLDDHCITSDIHKDPVQKKQCLASNAKGKQTKKPPNKKVIKKSNNSAIANCTKNKPCSRESTHLKARKSNSIDLNTNIGQTKLFENQAISNNLDFEKVNFPIFISKENACNNDHSTSAFIHKNIVYSGTGQRQKRKSISMCPTTSSEISGIKTPRLQNSSENSSTNFSSEAREFLEFSGSFETGQRLKRKSISMCPTTLSRISDSKIPLLQNSPENSGANSSSDARELLEFSSSFETGQRPKRKSISMCPTTPSRIPESKIPRLQNSSENCKENFSSEATSHMQKISKTRNTKEADSCCHPTKIPVKYNNDKSSLSTLQLSINDSSFLTPNRNALSPNSIVWMSGNKYFDSSSQEEEQFNKRESIAMILKSNPGHVQAKVHLYDDLIRENEYSTEIVPCHSTPTSKFSKRLSSISQSLKPSSKHKTKLQSSNSISYSKKTLANRSNSLQSGKKSQKLIHNAPLDMPSPIKGYSLKDVTNKGFQSSASKSSKNVQKKNNTVSIFLDENNKEAVETRKKLKRNSFSGNASQKLPKKVSRSESTPGPRPHRRISCLIQESNFAK